MKSICIIWHASYPWDVRIEKMIRTFTELHYKVSIVCRAKRGGYAFEEYENVTYYRAPAGIAGIPLPFNPFWIYTAVRCLRNNKVFLIIVRDLPMVWLGATLGKIFGIRFVLDMAENYPAALKAYNKPFYKILLLGNALIARLYEKAAAKLADGIFVVAHEQKYRLKKLGIAGKKIAIVHNTPYVLDCGPYTAQPVNPVSGHWRFPNEDGGVTPPVNGRDSNRRQEPAAFSNGVNEKIILYTGKLDAHRGGEVALYSMPEVLKAYPSAVLVFAGSGRKVETMKKIVLELSLGNKVRFTGWISHAGVYRLIKQSTVCLIPHLKSEHTDTTIPNKLFDYMLYAKPVVSSNLLPVEDILKSYRCGYVFQSGDPGDMARKIISALENAAISNLGENGRRAVLNRFRWDVDKKVMLSALNIDTVQ